MGLLTTLPRDEWATLRERIESTDAQNAATLETIDSALFALSLEDTAPKDLLDDMGDSASRSPAPPHSTARCPLRVQPH